MSPYIELYESYIVYMAVMFLLSFIRPMKLTCHVIVKLGMYVINQCYTNTYLSLVIIILITSMC